MQSRTSTQTDDSSSTEYTDVESRKNEPLIPRVIKHTESLPDTWSNRGVKPPTLGRSHSLLALRNPDSQGLDETSEKSATVDTSEHTECTTASTDETSGSATSLSENISLASQKEVPHTFTKSKDLSSARFVKVLARSVIGILSLKNIFKHLKIKWQNRKIAYITDKFKIVLRPAEKILAKYP